MTQLNLLPDVKLEFIKAQRVRRLVLSVAIIVSGASLALLVIMYSIDGLQKKHLNDLNKDIASETSTLENKPQISKILTVQNQLESLTTLHAGKGAPERLFTYLNQTTPSTVNINTLHIDFTAFTANISGTADSLSSVNTYVDTLKYTNYTLKGSSTKYPAFSNVVLSDFSLNNASTDASQAANYSITLSYDKTIFDITQQPTLVVPNQVTTRSELEQPTDLFKDAPASSSGDTKSTGGSN